MATALLMTHNTLYCVITQIDINSDEIFVQFLPFVIKQYLRLPTGTWTSCDNMALCHLHTHVFKFGFTFQKSECNVACIVSFGNFNAGLGS